MVLSIARFSLRSYSIRCKRQTPICRALLGNQSNPPIGAGSRSMATYVVDPPPLSSLPVLGTRSRFPVRRVYCVGKNYAAHVVEMGGDLERSNPVFFTKPSYGGVVYAGPPELDDNKSNGNSTSTSIKYPPDTSNLHYEVELVVAIGKDHNNTRSNDNLQDCIYGYAVGIDLTRRDLQGEAKSKGHPWDTGKYFDESAPMGPITPVEDANLVIDQQTMELTVNGETRQSVRLENMIWKVPEIIRELSKSFQLKSGDLIMSGTPSGVGPVVPGDRLVGTIDGLERVDITLV